MTAEQERVVELFWSLYAGRRQARVEEERSAGDYGS